MANITKTMANQGDGEYNQVKAQASLKNEQRCKNTKPKKSKMFQVLTQHMNPSSIERMYNEKHIDKKIKNILKIKQKR
jgi:hypothetical protein